MAGRLHLRIGPRTRLSAIFDIYRESLTRARRLLDTLLERPLRQPEAGIRTAHAHLQAQLFR